VWDAEKKGTTAGYIENWKSSLPADGSEEES
jgi:hypothetical protein